MMIFAILEWTAGSGWTGSSGPQPFPSGKVSKIGCRLTTLTRRRLSTKRKLRQLLQTSARLWVRSVLSSGLSLLVKWWLLLQDPLFTYLGRGVMMMIGPLSALA